ncbi:rod shape-determining protein MreC [Caldisalinibacter kiritimatiensis]|uniref:Cell shape-determining protein MreC n=1 Tax=Caldisalinibacter kiritimatiensis TaxID=1304284 RepID=R1AT59_9FIRM|nr:rod shape-determining protein MreC [Caldisalinibacter kiritimatiensis]EOC99826.1 Rod shape-determining protein MreC [Caldisalinibacter kiritimatiensis]
MSIFKKYGNRMIVTVVTIILIIIISLTSKDRNSITFVENNIGNVVTPVQKFVYKIGKSVSNTFNSIANFTKLKEENEQFKKEIARLKKINREMEDIIAREDILRNEAILKQKSRYDFIKAQVVGKNPNNWFDKFTIDKGLKDGIKKGDSVVKAVVIDGEVVEEGLVGHVIEVGDNWAKVLPIIDEGSKVSFRVLRTQDGGIVEGSIDGDLSGYFFDTKANAIKGDKLMTSGLGGLYEEGLYIGNIVEVSQKSDELVKQVKIKPSVDFKKIYDVFVIISKKE